MSNEAKAWFDQFINHLEMHPEIQGNDQWCARHWAPCPVLHANGIVAAMEMIGDWAAMQASNDPHYLNAAMMRAGKICCTLGDQKMYEIWGKCPPS